jgi:hypothetical protein
MGQVQDELERIVGLPTHRLRIQWRLHFRSEPPRGLSRDQLLRAITYKMQERVYGGLTQAAKKALRHLAAKISSEGTNGALSLPPTLKPGMRLVREWRGQMHSVVVMEDGFEYHDHRYRSLTEIARHITGAHWSGPRFFGVVQVRTKPMATPARRSSDHAAGAVDGQV